MRAFSFTRPLFCSRTCRTGRTTPVFAVFLSGPTSKSPVGPVGQPNLGAALPGWPVPVPPRPITPADDLQYLAMFVPVWYYGMEKMENGKKILLTVAEVAKTFRVHDHTVRSWVRRGQIGCLRIGGALRIPASEVTRLTTFPAPSSTI